MNHSAISEFILFCENIVWSYSNHKFMLTVTVHFTLFFIADSESTPNVNVYRTQVGHIIYLYNILRSLRT